MGNSNFGSHSTTLLPEAASVVLLGDGEYDSVELLTWLTTHTNWAWGMRTACDTQICTEGEWLTLSTLAVHPGQRTAIPEVQFTRAAFGPVQTIVWWGRRFKEPLYLVTNLELADEACYWYRRRYRIETLFSDQKSRGFHIHQSHLSDPARLARLLIAACLAYVWMVYLGVEVCQHAQRDLIDRTERTDKSLFRLGLDWLTYLLKHGKPFPVCFRLPLIAKL